MLQVFYHLGELDDALTYALGAGTHFDINEQSEYVQTLLGTNPLRCNYCLQLWSLRCYLDRYGCAY